MPDVISILIDFVLHDQKDKLTNNKLSFRRYFFSEQKNGYR